MNLQPDYSYTYWVLATNSAGWIKGLSKEFKAVNTGVTPPGGSPVPPPENTSPPYKDELSPWVIEGTEKAAAERTAKEQAERKAKEVHEQEEREAGESPLKLVLAREEREAAEVQAAQESESSVVQCVVPALKGDSLSRARRALSRAHCRLGKVSKPRRRHGALVVTAQSVRAGRKSAKGAGIAVKLAPTRG
jgi:hypothetical protein